MNKTLSLYLFLLFLLGIITYAHAADIAVEVGGLKGKNIFFPREVLATVGDNIVFTWKSGKHSIIESDTAKSCVKSLKPNAFNSGGAFMAPKTWTLTADVVGKTWFYCDVPGHCTPGYGGMQGMLIVRPGKTAPPPGNPDNPPSSPDNNDTDNKNTDNKASTIGAIIGGLGGILLTIGSFFLYIMFKRNKSNKDAMLAPEDNRDNQDIILIPGSNEISENNNVHNSDSNTEVYNL